MNKLLSIFLLMVIFISFNVKGMEGDGSEKEDFLEGEENLTQLCLEKDITGTPAGCIVNCFPVMEKSCFLPGWKKALGGSEFQQIFNEERRCFASQFLGFDRYFRNQQKRRPLIVLVIGESGFSPSGRPKMRFHCPTTKTRYLFLDPCICEGRFIVENMPENAWGIKGFVSDLEKFPFLEGQIDYFMDDINLLC